MKKKLKDEISAIPSKRIYRSIIADYHLNLSLCELIDNAIDNWIYNGRPNELEIVLDLDYDQQSIQVKDNSGGIKEEDIQLIVSPGQSREASSSEIIGVFGVGSKRAVIAMAKQIKIFTRHSKAKTLLVEINDDWIEDEDNWNLPVFEVDDIEQSSTKIELTTLREKIDKEKHDDLIEHLGVTYALFLEAGGMKIILNGEEIVPKTFDSWSYPPGYEPREGKGPIKIKGREDIQVSITGGLTKSHKEMGSNNEEYGVYFYCNDRLIARAYKGDEIGFNTPFRVGNPHPSFSITRVIVKLNGEVDFMPWNSSKSAIDFKHKTFEEIAPNIINMFTTYAMVAKDFGGQWPEKVFHYKKGAIKRETLKTFSKEIKFHVPVIKRSLRQPKYIDLVKKNNSELAEDKPWVVGLYEAIIAVEEIGKLKLEQNNRICLLILDSTLEIAFKEYLLNESSPRYSEARIAGFNRIDLQNEAKGKCRIKQSAWDIIDYYYLKRCDLVHKRATTQISNSELENYRKIVEYSLSKMFKIDFSR